MNTIAENLQTLITNKANIKSAIERKLDKTVTQDMSLWPSLIDRISSTSILANHCDENGKWHKPEEWPDIESLPLPEDKDTVYLLYGTKICNLPFISVSCNRQATSETLTVEKGSIVNGEFVASQLMHSGEANYVIQEDLSLELDDYIIYKILSSNGLSLVVTSNWDNLVLYNNACLMRYGRMRYGYNPTFRSYYLESDNILDLGKNRTAANRGFNTAYLYNIRMQRWRHTGWDTTKNVILSTFQMFCYCFSLSDIDEDLSGWITSTCANIGSMFLDCLSLKRVNVSNWNVTNISGNNSSTLVFSGCRSLEHIEGLDTWSTFSAPALTSFFNGCNNLKGELDLRNWNISSSCTTFNSLFNECRSVKKIDISTWSLAGATSVASMFLYCYSLKEIALPATGISNLCTTMNTIFNQCVNLKGELVLDSWDFSGCSNWAGPFHHLKNLTKLELKDCVSNTGNYADTSASYLFIYWSINLKYLDVSCIDMACFTGTYIHSGGFRYLFLLEDFYPPKNISKNFNIGESRFLSHDSLLRILNNLKSGVTSTTCTLGAMNLDKLTAAEKAIATNKGWTLA